MQTAQFAWVYKTPETNISQIQNATFSNHFTKTPKVNLQTFWAQVLKCEHFIKFTVWSFPEWLQSFWLTAFGFFKLNPSTLFCGRTSNHTLSRAVLRATLLLISLWARLSFSCSRRRLASWSRWFSFCQNTEKSIKLQDSERWGEEIGSLQKKGMCIMSFKTLIFIGRII